MFSGLVKQCGCAAEAPECIERIMALLCLTAFHDVMKVEALLPRVQAEHAPYLGYEAGVQINDHDIALSYILEQVDLARNIVPDEKMAEFALKSGKCAIPAKELKLVGTFVEFMEKNKELRDLIERGKGNLQWERDIPPASLNNLEGLASKDFKGNLGQIIHDIYQTAHVMFADMPQGDHKKRAKYRFASKTLMRILPEAKRKEVEKLIETEKITLDLYEILGQCTWSAPA